MIAGRKAGKGLYLLRCLLVPEAGCFDRCFRIARIQRLPLGKGIDRMRVLMISDP